jgi:3-hydroxy-3-methylglutaryl CoA synthase
MTRTWLRVGQKVGDKEEIIFNKKEEKRNDQRRKINVTEYRETDKPMDKLGHLNNLKKRGIPTHREIKRHIRQTQIRCGN